MTSDQIKTAIAFFAKHAIVTTILTAMVTVLVFVIVASAIASPVDSTRPIAGDVGCSSPSLLIVGILIIVLGCWLVYKGCDVGDDDV